MVILRNKLKDHSSLQSKVRAPTSHFQERT